MKVYPVSKWIRSRYMSEFVLEHNSGIEDEIVNLP